MRLAIHFPNFTTPGEPASLATLLAKLGISQIWIAATSPDPAGFDPAGSVSRLTDEVLPRLSQI